MSAANKNDWVLTSMALHPLLKGRSGLKLHVTAIHKNGIAYHVKGYVEGSVLGDLRLPNDLYIVKENGDWKWQIGDLKVANMSGDGNK